LYLPDITGTILFAKIRENAVSLSKTISKTSIGIFFLVAGIVSVSSQDSYARNKEYDSYAVTSYEAVYMPELTSTSVVLDDDNDQPQEPNIGETTYLKLPPVSSIGERVDRLLYGVQTAVTPEHDMYGYEIRRYMAHVGNMQIYEDQEFLLEQYRNARKAEVIAEYWAKYIDQEISEIEDVMDKDDGVPLAVRTTFRQNKVTVTAFLIIVKGWVHANRLLLEKIGENPELYHARYPEILIVQPEVRTDFYHLVAARQAKLKEIQNYESFAMMVY